MVNKHRDDWDQMLLSTLWSYRTPFKVATGLTPFKLAFSMEVITTLEYVVPSSLIMVAEHLIPKDFLVFQLGEIFVVA